MIARLQRINAPRQDAGAGDLEESIAAPKADDRASDIERPTCLTPSCGGVARPPEGTMTPAVTASTARGAGLPQGD